MICKKCGADNAPIKKCCARCGSFLSGMTINNVTGEYGYRGDDGLFYESEEKYNDKKNEPKHKNENRPKCKKHNITMKVDNVEFLEDGSIVFWLYCEECKNQNESVKDNNK